MHYVKPSVTKIPMSPETSRLYALEQALNSALTAAAKEYARVRGNSTDEFWTRSLPQALFDLLDAFDVRAGQIAASSFLDFYSHERDADCAPFLNTEGCCEVCGVVAGDPCPQCKGRSFHVSGCTGAEGITEVDAVGPFPSGKAGLS